MVATEEMPARLTDEQVEQMSQEEFLAYFERLRQVAAQRGIPVVAPKVTGGAVSFESVLSRAAIHARGHRAFEAAQSRDTATQEAFNTSIAAYLKSANLEELTPELQERIDTHVREALERAQSGYAKTSATNKGRAKGSTNVADQTENQEGE